MPSSSLFLRSSTTFVSALSLFSSAFAAPQSLYERQSTAPYQLVKEYSGSNFFDQFSFFDQADPTHGYVTYGNRQYAVDNNLISYDGTYNIMKVDNTNTYSRTSGYYNVNNVGRKSVRIEGTQKFTHALIVTDIAHMPSGICGTWPAFWTLGDNWPYNGEIDIIEGANKQGGNWMSLHTGSSSNISPEGSFSAQISSSDCNVYTNGKDNPNYTGCKFTDSDSATYDNYNGGVWAMQWTSERIKVWFWPYGSEPSDVKSANPRPDRWGTPRSNFAPPNTLRADANFNANHIIFDTTFCGDLGDATWQSSGCAAATRSDSCASYVANNPHAFDNAFWKVKYVKVYQNDGPVTTTTTTSSKTTTTSSKTTTTSSKTTTTSSSTATTTAKTTTTSSSTTTTTTTAKTTTSSSSTTTTSSSSSKATTTSSSSASTTTSSAATTTTTKSASTTTSSGSSSASTTTSSASTASTTSVSSGSTTTTSSSPITSSSSTTGSSSSTSSGSSTTTTSSSGATTTTTSSSIDTSSTSTSSGSSTTGTSTSVDGIITSSTTSASTSSTMTSTGSSTTDSSTSTSDVTSSTSTDSTSSVTGTSTSTDNGYTSSTTWSAWTWTTTTTGPADSWETWTTTTTASADPWETWTTTKSYDPSTWATWNSWTTTTKSSESSTWATWTTPSPDPWNSWDPTTTPSTWQSWGAVTTQPAGGFYGYGGDDSEWYTKTITDIITVPCTTAPYWETTVTVYETKYPVHPENYITKTVTDVITVGYETKTTSYITLVPVKDNTATWAGADIKTSYPVISVTVEPKPTGWVPVDNGNGNSYVKSSVWASASVPVNGQTTWATASVPVTPVKSTAWATASVPPAGQTGWSAYTNATATNVKVWKGAAPSVFANINIVIAAFAAAGAALML